MAMMPTAKEAIERMQNWITSVITTLNIPPLITYTVVIAMSISAYWFGVKCQGRKFTANLPMPLKA